MYLHILLSGKLFYTFSLIVNCNLKILIKLQYCEVCLLSGFYIIKTYI